MTFKDFLKHIKRRVRVIFVGRLKFFSKFRFKQHKFNNTTKKILNLINVLNYKQQQQKQREKGKKFFFLKFSLACNR